MSPPVLRTALAALAAGVAAADPVPVPGEPSGRYQAVVIQEGSGSGPGGRQDARVMILDTAEGHLWTWSENELLSDGGARRFGTALTYQGRVQPGRRMGEVVDKHIP